MLKGTHCQSNTYQSYQPSSYCVNPGTQAASHQYPNRSNHQMQSGMSYGSSHVGTYVSSQSQYGSMNQTMYGNPQHSYTTDNSSMQQVKSVWGACNRNGNSSDVMQPYCQATHSPVVNSAHCMPSLSMRSPPHDVTNTTPTSSTSHCYRQGPLQSSSNQSSHSWPHSQIPNSLMFHSSCTASSVSNHAQSSSSCQQSFMPSTTSALSQLPPAVLPQAHQHEDSAPITVTENNSVCDTISSQESCSLQPLQTVTMLDSKPISSPVIQSNCNKSCSEQSPVHIMPSHVSSSDQNGNNDAVSPYPTYYNLDQNNVCTSPSSLSNLSSSVVGSVSNTSDISENSASGVDANSTLTDGLNGVLHDSNSPSEQKCEIPFVADLEHVKDDSKLHMDETDKRNMPLENVSTKLSINTCIENFNQDTVESEDSKTENLSTFSAVELGENTDNENEEETSSLCHGDTEQNTEGNTSSCGENISLNNVANGNSTSECDTSLTDSVLSPTDVTRCDQMQTEEIKIDTFHNTSKETKCIPYEGSKRNLRRRKCAISYQETLSPEWDSKFEFGFSETSTPLNKHPTIRPSDRRGKKCKSTGACSKNDLNIESPVKDECKEIKEENDHSHNTLDSIPLQTSDESDKTENAPSDHLEDEQSNCDELKTLAVETPTQPRKDNNHSPPQIIVLSPALPRKSGTNKSATVPEGKTVPQGRGSYRKSPSKKCSRRSSGSDGIPDNSLQKKKGRASRNRNRSKSQPDKKKKTNKKGKPKKKLPALVTNEITKVKKKTFSGPYVHITGTKARPLSVTVINVPVKEVEKDVKYPKQKRDYSLGGNLRKKLHVGHTSTLSPFYDAFTKDKTWVCVFCHNGSHYCGLGDLYGPYYMSEDQRSSIQITSSVTQTSSADCIEESDSKEQKNVMDTSPEETVASSRRIRSKRKRSELVEEFFKSTMSKKSKQIKRSNSSQVSPSVEITQIQPSPPPPPPPPPLQETTENNNPDSISTREFWVHEDCAVWSHGICIMAQRIYGLEEAVKEASNMVCSKCKLNGATLGCWNKGCREQYHFVCAKDKGCEMNEENLFVVCPKHQYLSGETNTGYSMTQRKFPKLKRNVWKYYRSIYKKRHQQQKQSP